MKIVILCNGDFPSASRPLQALAEADHIVCCDGAYDTLISHRPSFSIPLTVIGDLDSIGVRTGVACIHVADQTTNDQTKAFRHVRNKWPEAEVTILGATGKREDHTIGNISLLADYLESICDKNTEVANSKPPAIRMLTNYGCFTPINRRAEFASFARQQVSLFSMSHGCLITTEGLEYPLRNESLPRLWQGTLNASLGDTFTITPDKGIVIVYQTYEAKVKQDC